MSITESEAQALRDQVAAQSAEIARLTGERDAARSLFSGMTKAGVELEAERDARLTRAQAEQIARETVTALFENTSAQRADRLWNQAIDAALVALTTAFTAPPSAPAPSPAALPSYSLTGPDVYDGVDDVLVGRMAGAKPSAPLSFPSGAPTMTTDPRAPKNPGSRLCAHTASIECDIKGPHRVDECGMQPLGAPPTAREPQPLQRDGRR